MVDYAEPLARLLAGDGKQGVLIVYVSPGKMWKEAVQLVSSSDDGLRASALSEADIDAHKDKLLKRQKKLQDLKETCDRIMRQVETRAPSLRLLNRVRIVSPLDFVEVLDSVKARQRDDFVYWFEQTTYDVRLVTRRISSSGLSPCAVVHHLHTLRGWIHGCLSGSTGAQTRGRHPEAPQPRV